MPPRKESVKVNEAKALTEGLPHQRGSRSTFRRVVSVIIVLVILGGLGYGGYYLYLNYFKKSTGGNSTQQEISKLTAAVAKIIDVPTDEQPEVAVVSDKEKLSKEVFFAKAENDDRVLVYSKAKIAVLYRPSLNKIINYAPLSVDNSVTDANAAQNTNSETASIAAPAEEIKPYSVAFYNGTTTSGLARDIEKKLQDTGFKFTSGVKANAAKNNYTQTVVVDVTGNNAAQAQAIATELNGVVGPLPEGEKASSSDILVILGK